MIFLWGANARENHPIFFHHVLKGIHNGARMYAVDPRRTSTAQWADVWLGLNVGTDIALANAMAREIIHAGLANEAFIAGQRPGSTHIVPVRRALHAGVRRGARRACRPTSSGRPRTRTAGPTGPSSAGRWASPSTTTPSTTSSPSSISRCSPAMLAGYGSGLNPLRGQNNVQGGGDMGAIPESPGRDSWMCSSPTCGHASSGRGESRSSRSTGST